MRAARKRVQETAENLDQHTSKQAVGLWDILFPDVYFLGLET